MKRLSLLALLVAILAVTAWIGDPQPAHAMPFCADLNGQPCSPEGQQLSCRRANGSLGGCACSQLPGQPLRWFCF